jgi:hypothetical protein
VHSQPTLRRQVKPPIENQVRFVRSTDGVKRLYKRPKLVIGCISTAPPLLAKLHCKDAPRGPSQRPLNCPDKPTSMPERSPISN